MYSPKIKEEFIPVLYKMAKDRKKPMTAIVNAMIAESLKKFEEANDYAAQGQKDAGKDSGTV